MYSLPLPLNVFEVGNITEYMTSKGNIAKDLAGSICIVVCMSWIEGARKIAHVFELNSVANLWEESGIVGHALGLAGTV